MVFFPVSTPQFPLLLLVLPHERLKVAASGSLPRSISTRRIQFFFLNTHLLDRAIALDLLRDPTAFTGNSAFAYGHEADGCMANGPLGGQCNYRAPVSPAFGVPAGISSPQLRTPFDGFEFQPSKVCPRNLIIFDHTDDKGRVMYHPTLVNKLNPTTNNNAFPSYFGAVCRSSGHGDGNLEEDSSSFKEDTREIDALLSSDEESDEDDVVSSGRTPVPMESGLLDSSSPEKFKKMRQSSENSLFFHESMGSLTHEKMRKMVAVLREIIPGGDELDTPSVLEEAVRYLKFLKMEAKKLGVEGSNN